MIEANRPSEFAPFGRTTFIPPGGKFPRSGASSGAKSCDRVARRRIAGRGRIKQQGVISTTKLVHCPSAAARAGHGPRHPARERTRDDSPNGGARGERPFSSKSDSEPRGLRNLEDELTVPCPAAAVQNSEQWGCKAIRLRSGANRLTVRAALANR